MSKKDILDNVENYYSSKINKHGATPAGVDWNSTESQYLRFKILSNVINKQEFSILDFGCGYGAYYTYLKKEKLTDFRYVGYDISESMIDEANRRIKSEQAVFSTKLADQSKSDFLVASGIFNVVPENTNINSWKEYILETIKQFDKITTSGFSFNMLTSYSDKDKMRDNLHYANPMEIFDFLKKNISKEVAVLHDYKLYEFTMIIRKNA